MFKNSFLALALSLVILGGVDAARADDAAFIDSLSNGVAAEAEAQAPAAEFDIDEALRRRVTVWGSTNHGYANAFCPAGFRVEYCSFDNYSCDNTSQAYNYCRADSRNNRNCTFQAHCISNQPERRRIQGGRAGGYDYAYCPRGFVVERCDFDTWSCDNTQRGYDFCAADSRNNRPCRFTGVCVERW